MIERVYYRVKLNTDQIIYSQHIDIAQEMGQYVNKTMSQKAITDELNKKFDKAGGHITGDVNIDGNVNISGVVTKVDTETLQVRSNLIMTNSDDETLVEKSGVVIRVGNGACYGIVYDPSTESVMLGKGKITEADKFVFDSGEGAPVTTRADSNLLVGGHLLQWDATKRRLVDSGYSVSDFEAEDTITKINLTNGDVNVTYDTINGVQVISKGQIEFEKGSPENIDINFDVPIIAGDGILIDKDWNTNKIVIKTTAASGNEAVLIDAPAETVQGTITDAQLAKLQESDTNYIMFNNEKYYLGDKGHLEGYLGYTYNGYENNKGWQKTITITISTKAWVLSVVDLSDSNIEVVQDTGTSTTKVMSQNAVTTAINTALESGGAELEAKLNENIIKNPSKTYLVWKGDKFPNSTNATFKAPAGCTIDWGDGLVQTFNTESTEVTTHTYTDGIEYHLISLSNYTLVGDGALLSCSGLTSITIGNSVTSIGEAAFRDCIGLTSVIWNAENCTSVGSSSYPIFSNCSKLTNVTIGENVKTIPSYAFGFCTGLTNVTIGNGVTSIENNAFYYCRSLTSITIPDSVTSIGDDAFKNCNKLKIIRISATNPPTLGSNTFETSVEKILVPKSAINTYKTAAGWSQYAGKIVYEVDSSDLGSVEVDNRTITKTPNEEIQAVALTNGTDLLTYAEILQATTIERL